MQNQTKLAYRFCLLIIIFSSVISCNLNKQIVYKGKLKELIHPTDGTSIEFNQESNKNILHCYLKRKKYEGNGFYYTFYYVHFINASVKIEEIVGSSNWKEITKMTQDESAFQLSTYVRGKIINKINEAYSTPEGKMIFEIEYLELYDKLVEIGCFNKTSQNQSNLILVVDKVEEIPTFGY